MNLLDYQKSGNALGSTITPKPVFNPLKGLIPQIPSIYSIITQNNLDGDLNKFTNQIIYNPDYFRSAYGYKYQLISENGLARYPVTPEAPYPYYESRFHASYDPFRQCIGSFPDAPGTPFLSGGEGKLTYKGEEYKLAGYAPVANYIPYTYNNLPPVYGTNIGFSRFRFSGVVPLFIPEYMQQQGYSEGDPYKPTEDLPIQNSSLVSVENPFLSQQLASNPPTWRVNFPDPIGQSYQVFNYRKEQYIYLFGKVKHPYAVKPGGSAYSIAGNDEEEQKPFPAIIDQENDYHVYCNATKLNFMSMFSGILQKTEGISYDTQHLPMEEPGENNVAFFDFRGPSTKPPYRFEKTMFEFSPAQQMTGFNDFFDLIGMPNPASQNGISTTYFPKMTSRVNRFAYTVFKEIESKLYKDVSFDVEPDVVGTPTVQVNPSPGAAMNLSRGVISNPADRNGADDDQLQGFVAAAGSTITSFPGGVPYNKEVVGFNSPLYGFVSPIPVPQYQLTANIKSVYNYLSTDWENVLPTVPETAIPPIFISDGSYGGIDAVVEPTQDQLIAPKGKNSLGFTGIYNQVMRCRNYKEINDYSTLNGFGSHSRLIHVPNENYLKNIEVKKIQFPMYNEIEFDIYANTNSSFLRTFKYFGISRSILGCILRYRYAPHAKLIHEADVTPDFDSMAVEIFNNPEGKLAQLNNSYMASINSAIETGIFDDIHSFPVDLDNFPTPDSYIYNAVPINSQGSRNSMVGIRTPDPAYSPHEPDNPMILNLEKFYQYYVTKYNQLNGELSLFDVDEVELVNFKSPTLYDEMYSEFGPPDEGLNPGFVEIKEDSPESYILGVSSTPLAGELIQGHMPTINEILSHKPRYSEPFMYQIDKINDDQVIQRIFIPHFCDLDELADKSTGGVDVVEPPKIKSVKYIDTQVKYGEIYTYKIYQYRIVVGGDYRFVFSSNKDTHRRAIALGYTERYESDIIFKAGRKDHVEGEILFDAISKPPETPLVGAEQPFMFYTKGAYAAGHSGDEAAPLFDLKTYDSSLADAFPIIPHMPDYYSYDDAEERLNKLAIFKSMVYPNFRLVKVPYYEQTVVVSDFPPLPPNVNFDPQVGKGSTILMTFEHQVGDREEIPIIVEETDNQLFQIVRLAQNRSEVDQNSNFIIPQIRFKTDDFPKAYQIFVTDVAPNSYQDFKNKMTLELNVEDATAIQQPLVPNKKYYFMFRTVDIHGNISNPSMVYEVEMFFDAGVYFPIVNEYEFRKQSIGEKHRSFKQYAKIEAALIQRIVNRDKSFITDQSSVSDPPERPVLGVAPSSLWNEKKFKFRIISKHTGKAIDLNVAFKTKHTDSGVKGCPPSKPSTVKPIREP